MYIEPILFILALAVGTFAAGYAGMVLWAELVTRPRAMRHATRYPRRDGRR